MPATHDLQHAAAAEHCFLDELFESYQAWRDAHPAKARAFFRDFAAALAWQLAFEEVTAFPLYERTTGDTTLTAALRAENERIRRSMEALAGKVERGEAVSDRDEERLWEELLAHDNREESLLYPLLDEMLTEPEKEAAVQSLAGAGD
jgi:hypothetical protein